MINYREIIERIVLKVPELESRVGGTVAYGQATTGSSDVVMPHAFVMPADFKDFSLIEYDETFPEALKVKVVKEVFVIVLCLDNRQNRGMRDGGMSPAPLDMLKVLQDKLELAFAGWKPSDLPENAGAINLESGGYIDSDNIQLWYAFEFYILYRRNSAGFDPDVQAEIDTLVEDDSLLDTNAKRAVNRLVFNSPLGPVTPVMKEIINDDFALAVGTPRTPEEIEDMLQVADFVRELTVDDEESLDEDPGDTLLSYPQPQEGIPEHKGPHTIEEDPE